MYSEDYIKTTIIQITNELLECPNDMAPDYKLKLIGTESTVMIAFISALEEEFNVEIDDELISMRFFNDLSYLTHTINKLLEKD
jgi:acyl carrier protein